MQARVLINIPKEQIDRTAAAQKLVQHDTRPRGFRTKRGRLLCEDVSE